MTTEDRVRLNVADVDRPRVPGGGTCDSERTVGKSYPPYTSKTSLVEVVKMQPNF